MACMVRIQGRNVSIFPALSAAGRGRSKNKKPAGRRAEALANDQHRALGVADHRGGVGAQQIGGNIRPVRSDDHQVGG